MRYKSVPDLVAGLRASCGEDCFCAQDAEARLEAGEDEQAILAFHDEPPLGLAILSAFAALLGFGRRQPDLVIDFIIYGEPVRTKSDATPKAEPFDVDELLARAGNIGTDDIAPTGSTMVHVTDRAQPELATA